MMKQMQKMQKEMGQAQEELEEKVFTGVANDDLVKISMNGKREVQSVDIKDDVAETGDSELLEDLTLLALNDVLGQIEKETEDVMGQYTNNLNIPGM
ncbi:YbaB/EbfC family nucleoid-associated protein, partial [Salmonella enterica]|uniref:YbaB/EbfC family nucleoid-associated protein n=1 Tax=Salmonella enterica TaxID=28901 RepID=UPI000C225D00